MTPEERLYSEITARYGKVKRARSCFLYTEKGVRLTDMYQENGRAILGWGGSVFTVFKDVLSRGITGSFNTDHFYRLEKAVSDLLGFSCSIFLFSSESSARKALEAISTAYSIYEPFCQDSKTEKDAFLVIPPLPWTPDLWIAAVKNEGTDYSGKLLEAGLVPEKKPAPVLAAAARSIYDLIAEEKIRLEKHWFIYDPVLTKYWIRKGPYLVSKIPAEKYDDFVLHCLDCGIIINPSHDGESIVPFGADRGVFTALKNRPF